MNGERETDFSGMKFNYLLSAASARGIFFMDSSIVASPVNFTASTPKARFDANS
jgi:hypothetical protein